MRPIAYARRRWFFRPHVRSEPSYRDVEDPLAERGPGVSGETIRRWVLA